MIIADLHIHSRYSRATSQQMNLEGLSEGAKIKGIDILGTGDFTHPRWLDELKKKLEPDKEGMFTFNNTHFMLTGELSTIFTFENIVKKIHHVLAAPNIEIIEQINDKLKKYGNLNSDGRPILNISAPELTENLMDISKDIIIYPAHVWTPWFSVFGSKSGFDSMEDCYQDQIKHIFALETGLSSDPLMNWRLSSLDKFALLSNSDSHSPNPWRLGREANVFDLRHVNYKELWDAVKKKDKTKFLFTVEVDPNYGKYHFTGHRNCGINLNPKDAIKLNNKCPKCGKPLTIGVLQRVEQLADRPEGFIPKNAIPFKSLLPLYEIISYVTGTKQLYSKKIIEEQNKLIKHFGNEFNILLNVSKEDLVKITDERIADAIIKIREGKINYIPGYDGVYGEPVFEKIKLEEFVKKQREVKFTTQKTIFDFKGS
jgi:uncharacterized protein (TIGR00375 family)